MIKKLAIGLVSLVLTALPLAGAIPVSAAIANPIANPSVETAAGASPEGWTSGSWGSATPTFEHVNEGHTGSKSVKVTNVDATPADLNDGDAKWYFNPISTNVLQVGKQYRVSLWYKTNTQPQAVAMYLDAQGNQTFYGMPTPTAQVGENAATAWQPYSSTFSVPQGAVSVSVFLYVNQSGWVQSDDYSIDEYTPTGFSEPMVTLTFDDGHEDNHDEALTKMNQIGVKSTQCYATTFIEDITPAEQQQAVVAGIKKFTDAGHEICSHTVSHPDLTTVPDAQLANELQHSKQYLEQTVMPAVGTPQTTVANFASPFGAYNAKVNDAIKAAGYQSHRTVNEGYNTMDNFNPYELKVQNMLSTTTLAQFQSWVDQAIADKTWLVLVYHRVADNPGQYDTFINDFYAQMDYLKTKRDAQQLSVKTFQEGFLSAKAQVEGTTNPGGDTHAPVLSNITVGHTAGTTRIDWKADEFATHKFEYGTNYAYGNEAVVQISGEGDLTNSRYTALNLNPGVKYFYRITATDNAGNIGSIAGEFTTPAASGDTTAPIISDVHAVAGDEMTGGGFQVNWTTDEAASGKLEYGKTTAYGTSVNVPAMISTLHVHNMYNLTPSTKYYFRITATDAAGNVRTHTGEFTTPGVLVPGRTGDLTKDGVVNDDDATILFANWGNNPKAGDLDNNGVVDDDDATLLFANWSK